MEVLTLEESKKIITKFLRRFSLYDEKRVNWYFKKQYFVRLAFYGIIPYLFIDKGSDILLFGKLELPKETKNEEFKDILEKYEDYFTFSNETSYGAFPWIVRALKKITNNEILCCADYWEFDGSRRGINQRVLKYSLEEFFNKEKKVQNYVDNTLCSHGKVYLFPEDLSFFIELGDADLIASTKEFINKFKNALKHKDYDRLRNLRKGNTIIINNIKYKVLNIKIENKHTEILHIYLDKDELILESDLYSLALRKTIRPSGPEFHICLFGEEIAQKVKNLKFE